MIDIHTWDGCTFFHECRHAPISYEMRETKKCLVKGSPSYEILKSIVMHEKRFKDLKYLTQFRHSGELEALHSLYNAYCSKRSPFLMKECMLEPRWPLWIIIVELGGLSLSRKQVNHDSKQSTQKYLLHG